jgi:hypothetical protein
VNKLASQLGKLAAGVPKVYTAAELERRKKRLAEGRKKRWVSKAINSICDEKAKRKNDSHVNDAKAYALAGVRKKGKG